MLRASPRGLNPDLLPLTLTQCVSESADTSHSRFGHLIWADPPTGLGLGPGPSLGLGLADGACGLFFFLFLRLFWPFSGV